MKMERETGCDWLSQAQAARDMVVDVARVGHNGVDLTGGVGELPRVREYLIEAGVDEADLAKVMTTDSQIIWPEREPVDVEGLSVSDWDEVLKERLMPYYRLVNPSLDHAYPDGFNDHGMENHIDVVVERTLALLDAAGASDEQKKTAVTIARIHDVFNVFSRSLHAWVPKSMIEELVPELGERGREGMSRKVWRGVRLHDEKIAGKVLDGMMASVGVDEAGNLKEDFFEQVRSVFGVEALAVLVADKSQAVDWRRLSRKQTDSDALSRDGHLEVCALASSDGFVVDRRAGLVTQRIGFEPGMSREEEDVCPQFGMESARRNGHRRVRVGEETHRLHREDGVPHFLTWMMRNVQLHGNRWVVEQVGVFALFPDIQRSEIVVSDETDFEGSSRIEIVFGFERAGILEQMKYMRDNYALDQFKTRCGQAVGFFERLGEWWSGMEEDYFGSLFDGSEDVRSVAVTFEDETCPSRCVQMRFVVDGERWQGTVRQYKGLYAPLDRRGREV